MPSIQLILYSHAGCCLCDRLEELIAPHLVALRKRGPFELIKRDIADDPAWQNLYGDRIPVLMAEDRVLLEGRPAEEDVARAMAGTLSKNEAI